MRSEVTIAYETKSGEIKTVTFDDIEFEPKIAIPVAAKRAHAEDAEYRTIISGVAKPKAA